MNLHWTKHFNEDVNVAANEIMIIIQYMILHLSFRETGENEMPSFTCSVTDFSLDNSYFINASELFQIINTISGKIYSSFRF